MEAPCAHFLIKQIMEELINVTDSDFEGLVLQAELPFLLMFDAGWSNPCKTVLPIVQEASHTYNGVLKVGKLNTDDNELTAVRFGIKAVPTLLLFKDGSVVSTKVIFFSKSQLYFWLDTNR